MIEIKAIPGKLIMLGKQGENLAREVIFDVSGVRAEFGDGAFRLSAKRPGESEAYPATVTETGDTVVWALTGADTQNAGRGQCELAYYAGETRLKTWTYDTAIAKSLTGSPKTDPYDEFLDEVNRLAAEAAISQREAKNSENAAKNSEENAKASEDAAKTSEDNAAEYARAALAAEKKSEQNAENAASAAVSAGQYAQNAATSATNAATSEKNAKASENAAKTSETNAKSSESKAATSEKNAKASENAAKTSETNAKSSESRASASEKNAKTSETSASNSAKTASDKASAAATSETNAKKSETNAKASETNAEASKTAAETAAATATEKAAEIADSAAQIATNTENIGKNATGIKTNATDIDLLRRENVELRAKTDALWKLSEGKSYDFIEDSAEAYSKDVPTGGRFAQVEKIGGKTAVWNQWVDETKYIDTTTASVTATISGRRITMAGTTGSRGENFYIISRNFEETWNVVANHYYLFAGISKLTGLNVLAYNGEKVITVAFAGSTAKNAVFKPAFSGTSQLYFNAARAGVAVDVDCAPYLIDLTRLYGSGNEPTTAEDPRIAEIIAYAEKHPEYNAGELVSAGVDDVEVQGANLLDPKKTTLTEGAPYGLTITMTGENTFRISGVPSVTSAEDRGFVVASNSQEKLRGRGLKITAFPIKGTVISAWGLRTADEPFLAISVPLAPEVAIDVEFRFMVSAATPSAYSPYSLDTYPIPDTVKALPGYGWSAGSVCNEIVRREDGWDYVQRVGLPATTGGYTALDTPTTTDITDLMTGALPLMATEPGGTITMHHALADDGLTLDVPNTVKYIRDLKEVASSGTE